ncbi:MAG: hypothetical protein Q7T34_02290 [Candidatus Parcubacteria bacterium]|nr:hypothetical protein [Candidatus Parcubacteria bacterium]
MRNTAVLNRPYALRNNILSNLRFNLGFLWVILSVSLAILTAVYIYQINEVARREYLIRDYESKAALIQRENKNTQDDSSKFSSMRDLENLARLLNFEPVGKVYYIKVLGDGVASK